PRYGVVSQGRMLDGASGRSRHVTSGAVVASTIARTTRSDRMTVQAAIVELNRCMGIRSMWIVARPAPHPATARSSTSAGRQLLDVAIYGRLRAQTIPNEHGTPDGNNSRQVALSAYGCSIHRGWFNGLPRT